MSTSPIKIPEVTSGPIDPTKVSLLSLAPELRNKIYANIFERPDAILVHVDKFQDCRRQLMKRTKKAKYNASALQFLQPKGQVNTAVLRTCRQVYHEALPFLYGSNTFCLGSNVDNYKRRYWENVASWMEKIGGLNFSLLTRVDVRIGQQFRIRENVFILPLLKQLWREDRKFEITASFEGEKETVGSTSIGDISDNRVCSSIGFSTALQHLGSDSIDLKRHAYVINNVEMYWTLLYTCGSAPDWVDDRTDEFKIIASLGATERGPDVEVLCHIKDKPTYVTLPGRPNYEVKLEVVKDVWSPPKNMPEEEKKEYLRMFKEQREAYNEKRRQEDEAFFERLRQEETEELGD